MFYVELVDWSIAVCFYTFVGAIFLSTTGRLFSGGSLVNFVLGALLACYLAGSMFDWCYADPDGFARTYPEDVRLMVVTVAGFTGGWMLSWSREFLRRYLVRG